MPLIGVIGNFGWQEILLVLLIVVLLFGARRIPELARSLGEGIRGFRSSVRGDEAERPRDETTETQRRL